MPLYTSVHVMRVGVEQGRWQRGEGDWLHLRLAQSDPREKGYRTRRPLQSFFLGRVDSKSTHPAAGRKVGFLAVYLPRMQRAGQVEHGQACVSVPSTAARTLSKARAPKTECARGSRKE